MKTDDVVRTTEEEMLSLTVRELTDRFPDTMPVLSAQGIDLCCGGGHQVLEALTLHGADLGFVIPELLRIVESAEASR